MSKIKDFFKKCREKKKSKQEKEFLQNIVAFQIQFEPLSILGKHLLFPYFDEQIVKSVTEELGYDYVISSQNHKKTMVIIFKQK